MTVEQIREIARQDIEPTGLWLPDVSIQMRQRDDKNHRRIQWHVITNAPNRGAYAHLIIDDVDGTIVKRWHVTH